MTPPRKPTLPNAPIDDDLLDQALDETFPASDPIEPSRHEPLPPAHPPGSDVRDQ